jgi:succinate dehydrogenase flavin-adding protein (antitoxin of CptAB toxin-antitoxin module)
MALKKFLDKNFHGGSKADRENYVQMVSCKDIWDLKQLIE